MTLEVAKIISEMVADTPGLTIVHGGTGGYKEAKPRPSPLQKLTKYAAENNVRLKDLFHVFDKQKLGHLVEEDFRASLKVREREKEREREMEKEWKGKSNSCLSILCALLLSISVLPS